MSFELNTLRHSFVFFGKFVEKQKETGSIVPSSEWLCKVMVSGLVPGDALKGRKFLELGAGTGGVTKQILALLGPKDHLDVIECDTELAQSVQKLVDKSGKAHQVNIHVVYAQNFSSKEKYDHIFSSLPLTNFSHRLVQKIYAKINELLKPKGKFSYFEYMYINAIRLGTYYVADKRKYKNLHGVLKTKDNFLHKRSFRKHEVWANFPPAQVVHTI